MTTDASPIERKQTGPLVAPAPMYGREDERAILDLAFERVKLGNTRIVTVLGPAGIGKTRLLQEFVLRQRERTATAPLKVYRGSARDLPTPYGLFTRLLRARFGLVDGMDGDAARAQVREQVARVLEDRKVGDVLYFLGQFLELPFPPSPLTKAVEEDPQNGASLRRAVFKAFLEADAASGPLVLVLDDLHLAHDDSLEILRYLLEYLSGPVLILCAARPELSTRHEDWLRTGERRHDVIELVALDDGAAGAVVAALLTPAVGPRDKLVESAVAFAGGNPMMLEQMVRIYHDVGVLVEASPPSEPPSWHVHLERLSSAKLPMTIEDAVDARIAALDLEEKRLLEFAAVMGSVFWRGGFVALYRTGDDTPEFWRTDEDSEDLERLDEILEDLVERDYVLKLPDSNFAGTDEYIFKHNKERIALEDRLTASVRRRYHRTIADWLEQQGTVQTNEQDAAMLARHREAAGDLHAAGLTFLQAGDLARARYGHTSASDYYERALGLLADGAIARRIEALHNYGDVLQLAGRVDDAFSAFEEMRALAFRFDQRGKGGAAHNRIGRLHREVGSLDEAAQHLQTALDLFRSARDERGVASTIDDIGKLHWMRGEYDLAQVELRDALVRRQALGDRRSIALSLNNLGLVLRDSGDFVAAVAAFEDALRIRREIGDLVGVVYALNNLGTVAQDAQDFPRALGLFAEAREVALEIGDRNRLALILTNIGETHYSDGQPDKAIEVLRQAEELCDELGDKLGLAETLRGLGKAYMLHGDLVRARECIGRAVELFAAVRSKVHVGSALRTLGEITAAGGWGPAHTKGAREYFARSVAIFEQTGNELELAWTYRVYARFLRTEPEFADDPDALSEADFMQGRADEILTRLKVSLDRAGRRQPGTSVGVNASR